MTSITTIRHPNGITWRVNTAYAPLFLAGRAQSPRELLHSRGGAVIKKSPARVIFSTVLSGADRDLPVVIKVYRHPRLGDWLKANLWGSKGQQEWIVTTAAVERGLRTVTPVAYGELRRWGLIRESYLITVRVFDCVTLEEVLFSPDGTLRAPGPTRRRLIMALASLLRRMHDSGIYHRDLHPGNFLVAGESSAETLIYLLDLHRASVKRSLRIWQRIESLAQFNMFARISLSRSERLLFFNAYFGGDRPWSDEKRRFLDVIEARTRKMSWRLWRRREGRCLSANKYFMRLSFDRMRGFARRDEWSGEIARLLVAGKAAHTGAVCVKESRSKAMWEKELAVSGGSRALFIKQYKPKRGWRALTYLWRSSQAIRSWRGCHALRIRNIGTVNAIAALEERGPLRQLGNAYLVSDRIPNAGHLAAFIERQRADGDILRRQRLIRSLAMFMRRVHDLGVYQGDMKATNILVGAKNDGGLSFYITDLDFVRTGLRLSRRQVCRNLAQLNKSLLDLRLVSIWDRRRFLREYCGPRGRKEIRALWRRVARVTARGLRKSGRRFHHGGTEEKAK